MWAVNFVLFNWGLRCVRKLLGPAAGVTLKILNLNFDLLCNMPTLIKHLQTESNSVCNGALGPILQRVMPHVKFDSNRTA